MFEQLMPYLTRRPTDKEWALAVEFLGFWASKPGLIDSEAEVGMAIALSMYLEHRLLMGDAEAWKRIEQNVDLAKNYKRHELVSGQDGVRRIITEYEAGRRKLPTKEQRLDEAMSAGGWSE